MKIKLIDKRSMASKAINDRLTINRWSLVAPSGLSSAF